MGSQRVRHDSVTHINIPSSLQLSFSDLPCLSQRPGVTPLALFPWLDPDVLCPCVGFHVCYYFTHDRLAVCFLICLPQGLLSTLVSGSMTCSYFGRQKKKFGGHLQPLLPHLPWDASIQWLLSHFQFHNLELDTADSGRQPSEPLLLLLPHY